MCFASLSLRPYDFILMRSNDSLRISSFVIKQTELEQSGMNLNTGPISWMEIVSNVGSTLNRFHSILRADDFENRGFSLCVL